MPTINKRFLLRLVIVVLLITGAIVGLHTVQASRIPDALHRQAERAQNADKPEQAIRYLRQYLEFRPQDTNTQEKLAQLLRTRHGSRASTELLFLYDKILRSDPTRHAIRREAVMASLQLGRYTDAITHAEQFVKHHPTDDTVWRLLALAQVKLRRFDDAKNSYTAAVQANSQEPKTYQEFAEFLWLDRERPTEAKPVYDQMVAALPQKPDSYLARARFLIATTEKNAKLPTPAEDPVLVDLNTALKIEPAHAVASVLKGERLQLHRDVLGARDAYLAGLKQHPDDESLIRSLAWLEVNRGNLLGAIQVLEEGILRAKDGTEILVPLADLLLQAGDVAKTQELVKKLEGRRGKNITLRAAYLRGRLAMHEQRWADAASAFIDIRTRAVELSALETQANLLLAQCQQQMGETTATIDTLRLVTTKEPNNTNARLSLVYALLNLGKFAEAARELDLASNLPSATPTLLSLKIRLAAIQHGITTSKPETKSQLDQIALQLANRVGGRTADGALLLADYTMAMNRPDAAVAILQKELPRHPADSRVWLKLAEATATATGSSQALKILEDARGAIGDTAELRLALATMYVRDPAKLRDIRNLETNTESWTEEEQTRLLYGLINIADESGDAENVVRLYKKVVARRPRDLTAWLALRERAGRSRDTATAEQAEQTIARWEPKSAEAESLCSAWKSQSTSTPEQLVELLGMKPNRASACFVLARSFAAANRIAEAREQYLRAVRLEPMHYDTNAAYLAHLAVASDDTEARRFLLQLATDPRWAGEPFRRVVKAAVAELKTVPTSAERLLTEARRFVERQPGGLGWLADVYGELGRTADALTACEAIVRTPSATTDDWLRYAIRVAETRGQEAGVAVVVSAKGKLTPIAYSQLAASFRSSRVGQGAVIATETPSELRSATEARLAILLAQLNRTEAIQHLEEYLAKKPNSNDVAWATRTLAMLLTVRGEPADRKRAYELLQNAATASPDDQRAKVSVLATLHRFLDGEDRANVLKSAAELLEELTNTEKPREADRFQLSQIYQAQGRADDAVAIIQKLLNENPEKVEYLLSAIGILSEANQLDAVTPFAERLLAVAPNDSRALAAVIRWECRRGNLEKAFQFTDRYERAADLSAGEQSYRIARAAEWLADITSLPGIVRTPNGRKLADVATKKFESVLHTRPDLLVGLATVLAQDGRAAEALQKIEKLGSAKQPRWQALSGLAVLRSTKLGEAEISRVEGWLASALEREPMSIPLHLAHGEYYTLTGKFAQAEAAFRNVLQAEPHNLVALNNLAWLLAPQPEATKQANELLARAAQETGLTGELLDTRARIRISQKQFDLAERDAREALKQSKTPLRYFHLALAQRELAPEKSRASFELAMKSGLEERAVHPRDVEILRNWR